MRHFQFSTRGNKLDHAWMIFSPASLPIRLLYADYQVYRGGGSCRSHVEKPGVESKEAEL
jgi:hypothetical protein